MSLVNVDEAKQDSDPVERSAGDAAALRGWLQRNLRRSLICHFIFMLYFIAVSKWSNYHELIYPTERLQFFQTCFWLREKCSGLLECDLKIADAENGPEVPEKGVSDFYSYWNTSYITLVVLAANMFAAV